jgi:hypothetical protein
MAAGNAKQDVRSEGVYPARLGGNGIGRANVLTVAAHDAAGGLADFSNYSSTRVDIAAPGCGVKSPTIPLPIGETHGTSFAAPQVTFTAALLQALGLQSTSDVKRRIMVTSDYDPDLREWVVSSGRLNIMRAISLDADYLQMDGESQPRVGHLDRTHKRKLALCKKMRRINPEDILRATSIDMASGRFTSEKTGFLRVILKDEDGSLDVVEKCDVESEANMKFVYMVDQSTFEEEATISFNHWSEVIDYVAAR